MTPCALVTGGSGFVGGQVIQALHEHGVRIRALVRPTSRRAAFTGLPVDFVEGDLIDGVPEKAFDGVEYLFHVAADYRFWVPDPERMHAANVSGTERLLSAAHRAGVRRIVYTSSVVTVGVPPGQPGAEEDRVAPDAARSLYQRTKILAEQAVWRLVEAGAPVVIVNPSTPVGPGDWRPTPTGRLLVDYLNGRLPAFLETNLNWVDVRDVARGHWLAATKGRVGQRYIFGHENLPLSAFLQILARVSGRPAPRIRIPYGVAYLAAVVGESVSRLTGQEPQATRDGVRMARAPMQYTSMKAVTELGFPQTPIRHAIAEAVRWFREHGYCR